MAQYGLINLPLNMGDGSITEQPVAAGVTAAKSSTELSASASSNLTGLEEQVQKFYDISNAAEANKNNIEKFLLGSSCKTASIPLGFLCLKRDPGNLGNFM